MCLFLDSSCTDMTDCWDEPEREDFNEDDLDKDGGNEEEDELEEDEEEEDDEEEDEEEEEEDDEDDEVENEEIDALDDCNDACLKFGCCLFSLIGGSMECCVEALNSSSSS